MASIHFAVDNALSVDTGSGSGAGAGAGAGAGGTATPLVAPLEVERKWVGRPGFFDRKKALSVVHLEQHYVMLDGSTDGECRLRCKTSAKRPQDVVCILTFKTPCKGTSVARQELEAIVDPRSAEALKGMANGRCVKKTRYTFTIPECNGLVAEVDEFHEPAHVKGAWLTEVEFPDMPTADKFNGLLHLGLDNEVTAMRSWKNKSIAVGATLPTWGTPGTNKSTKPPM